jgi:hypothetical protein
MISVAIRREYGARVTMSEVIITYASSFFSSFSSFFLGLLGAFTFFSPLLWLKGAKILAKMLGLDAETLMCYDCMTCEVQGKGHG